MNINDLKVHIIEDEMIFALQLQNWLKDKVSNVSISTNTEDGAYHIDREHPDIVLLDNQLPGTNGIDVIQFYKEKSPSSILVLMSSVFRLDEITLGLRKGADYILNKRNETENGLNSIIEASLQTKVSDTPFWKHFEFTPGEQSVSSQKIAVLDEEEQFSFQLSMILNNLPSHNRHSIHRFTKSQNFVEHCTKNGVPNVLFFGYPMQSNTDDDVLNFLKNEDECKTIILSSMIDLDTAITLNLEGVSEFILKDENWQESILECALNMQL